MRKACRQRTWRSRTPGRDHRRGRHTIGEEVRAGSLLTSVVLGEAGYILDVTVNTSASRATVESSQAAARANLLTNTRASESLKSCSWVDVTAACISRWPSLFNVVRAGTPSPACSAGPSAATPNLIFRKVRTPGHRQPRLQRDRPSPLVDRQASQSEPRNVRFEQRSLGRRKRS